MGCPGCWISNTPLEAGVGSCACTRTLSHRVSGPDGGTVLGGRCAAWLAGWWRWLARRRRPAAGWPNINRPKCHLYTGGYSTLAETAAGAELGALVRVVCRLDAGGSCGPLVGQSTAAPANFAYCIPTAVATVATVATVPIGTVVQVPQYIST